MQLTASRNAAAGAKSGDAQRLRSAVVARRPAVVARPCLLANSRVVRNATCCPLAAQGRARVVAARAGAVAAPTKPTPVVKIDNLSDPFATVVSVAYGDKLGELLETITALKNLNLNIRRAKVIKAPGGNQVNTFFITEADTSEKIVKSARLEEIRMTVLQSLVATFPESAQAMAGGSKPTSSDLTQPLGRRRAVVQTLIDVTETANGAASLLRIVTADRPGLLVDIVRVLKDINLNVVSAEVDTLGSEARDEFFITYHGEPLTTPMVTLVTNALQYYLSLNEVAKEESY